MDKNAHKSNVAPVRSCRFPLFLLLQSSSPHRTLTPRAPVVTAEVVRLTRSEHSSSSGLAVREHYVAVIIQIRVSGLPSAPRAVGAQGHRQAAGPGARPQHL